MLETLDYTIRIGSTPTILYFDFYFIWFFITHNERTDDQTDWATAVRNDNAHWTTFSLFSSSTFSSLYIRSFELWSWALVCRTMQDWTIGVHIAVILRSTLLGYALCQVVLRELLRRFQGKLAIAFCYLHYISVGIYDSACNSIVSFFESSRFCPPVFSLPRIG